MLLPQQAGGGAGDHATGPLAQAGHWRCPGSAPDMASRPRRPQGHPQGSCQKCGDQRGDGVPCGPSNEEGGHHGARNQRANDSAASGTRLGEAVPMRRGGAGRGLRVDVRRLRGYYPPGGGGRGGGGAMRKVPPARGGGALLWCAGCAQWWHAKPGGSCAGVQECYRERGGLCPEHGALFAHRTWSHRATARGQQEADGVAAGADALAVSQDYPGAVAQEVRGNVDPLPEGIEERTGEDLGAPASRRAWMTTGQRQRSAREARVRREGPGAVPAGHPPGALAKQLPGALPKSRPTLGSAPPGALPKSAPAVAPPRGSQQGGPGGAGPAALPPGATAKSAVRPVGNQSQRPGGKEQPQPARRGRKRPRRDQAAADEEETEGEEAEAAEAAVSHTPAARGGSASSSEPSAPVAGPRVAQGRTRRGGHTTHPPQDSATR